MGAAADDKGWTRRWLPPLAALSLHVLAALALSRSPIPTGTVPRPAEDRLVDVVTVEEAPQGPVESAATDAPAGQADTGSAVATRAVTAPRPAAASAREERVVDAAPERAPRAETSEPPASPGPPPGPIGILQPAEIDLGIGKKNPFAPRSIAAAEAAEAKRAVDQALREPARQRERDLGLGPEGPVLTALADATARSVAPVRGRAVFVATSNAAGEVVSLELADAEGGRPGWADAARIALAGLVGKKLRVAPGSTRAVMRIEVVSAWKLPSGQDPGTDLTIFHIPVSKGEGKDSAKVSILDPIPKFQVVYLEIGPGVKVPVVSVNMNIFSATTDPSNLGARPSRVIHTRLLDSQVM